MFTIKNIFTLYGVLSVALLFFTLIVVSTKTYRTRRRFWFSVILAWIIALSLGSVLFLFLKFDTVFTIMIASLAGYITMGDLPFRKKSEDENFKMLEDTPKKDAAN